MTNKPDILDNALAIRSKYPDSLTAEQGRQFATELNQAFSKEYDSIAAGPNQILKLRTMLEYDDQQGMLVKPEMTKQQEQLLDSIVSDINHNDTLTVEDAAKFPSFPTYEIGGQFILHVVDNYKFYTFLGEELTNSKPFDLLFNREDDPATIMQEKIQSLGADGKLADHLDEYGLTIADFSVTD